MLKLILSLVLMISSLFIGQSMSSRLYRRKETLSLFIRDLRTAVTKLEYSEATLYELFDSFSFESDQPFVPQWEGLISRYHSCLNKKDIAILTDFARELGGGDTQSQIRHIQYYLSLLEMQQSRAQEDIDQKANLYRILGFSAGVTISLMLI